MLDSWRTYFEQLPANVRFADLLDVGVIAVLIYFCVVWIRQRGSRSVGLGVGLIVIVYFAARWLDMYLTTMLFQVGLWAVVVALAVVFQDDIRRAFERLAAGAWLSKSKAGGHASETIDILVESLWALAGDRTGALIVLAGHEPLDRHVRSGVVVDGHISLPLLYSIFHPKSPGHDGAVLIAEDRIKQLGTHLPLSKNPAQTGAGGTRHAAALGLAECTDALVLVVSEERGTVSVAQHGTLKSVQPAELKKCLENYFQENSRPLPQQGGLRRWGNDAGWKIVSLVLAVAAWLLLAYRVETVQRTFPVPIEYRNLADDLVIQEPRAELANVAVSGTERSVDLLEVESLVISLDLSHVHPGRPYVFQLQESLDLPADVSVNRIEPQTITVRTQPQPPVTDQ